METTKGKTDEGDGMFDEVNTLLNVINAPEVESSTSELDLNIKETEISLEKEENLETNLEGKKNLAGESVESTQLDEENSSPKSIPLDLVEISKNVEEKIDHEENSDSPSEKVGEIEEKSKKDEEIEEKSEKIEETNNYDEEKCEHTNDFSVETQDKDESSDEVSEKPKQNQEETTSLIEKSEEIASTDEKISNEVDEPLSSEIEESDSVEKKAECSYVKVEFIEEESKDIEETFQKDENFDDIALTSVKSESSLDKTELTESSTFSDVKSQMIPGIFENKIFSSKKLARGRKRNKNR